MTVHQKASSMQKSLEESAVLVVSLQKTVSKAMKVFYNPVMKLNRDVAVLLLKAWKRKKLRLADPLAGTGVRAIRFLKELPASKITHILINDANPAAEKLIKKHIALNKVNKRKTTVHSHDASICLLSEKSHDYIEIDPFGTPNPFLDAAVKKLRRKGIIAVTATDTAALAGNAPGSCMRKYWAKPLRNECMHELGLRILIRKIQLIGAQHDKALTPVCVHATAHYVRAYLVCEQSKNEIKDVLKRHGYFLYCWKCKSHLISPAPIGECCKKQMDFAGPLWLGTLFDKSLVKEMHKHAKDDAKKLLQVLASEADSTLVGFYDLHVLASALGMGAVKNKEVIKAIKKKGATATETHFSPYGIKTDLPLAEIKKILKSLSAQAK